jgi:hypothetical protein
MDLMGFKRLLFEETEETLVRNPRDDEVRDKRGLIDVISRVRTEVFIWNRRR